MTAVDASVDALAVAQANADCLGLAVAFAQADWLTARRPALDLICPTRPTSRAGDPHLAALRHEPLTALVSRDDGSTTSAASCRRRRATCEGGWLLLEHGLDQAAAVARCWRTRGFDEVQSRRDLAGIARASGGIWRTVK